MRRPRVVRRSRLTRSPLAYWAMVGVLALLTGLVVARSVRTTGSLAARYGPLRPVVVATHRLDPGAAVAAGDIGVRLVPGSMAPAGALRQTRDALGRTVVVPVFAGLPVMEGHLAASGLRGVAALLPPGARAVAVPNGGAPLPLVPGDNVDVLATFDPSGSTEADPTFPVARGALVVDVAEDSVTVAVAPQEAARVAFAVTTGVVTLALAAPVAAISEGRSPRAGAQTAPPPPGR
jgi:Flp pilus assembly protein CpaB